MQRRPRLAFVLGLVQMPDGAQAVRVTIPVFGDQHPRCAHVLLDAFQTTGPRDGGVAVGILLESSTEHGGTVRGDSVKAVRDSVAGASIYVWDAASRMADGDAISAAVHAKCAVADRNLAFITSANLTTAALERNMELGMLIRGGTVPDRLRQHLAALVATKVVAKLS